MQTAWPICDQNGQNRNPFSKNYTPWDRTYLYSNYPPLHAPPLSPSVRRHKGSVHPESSASFISFWQSVYTVRKGPACIACVASVPVGAERNNRAARSFAFRTRGKWGESKKEARKMGREQKGRGRGVGEGKGGNACPQTPQFWKTRSPTNGASDWCGVVYLIDRFDMEVSYCYAKP